MWNLRPKSASRQHSARVAPQPEGAEGADASGEGRLRMAASASEGIVTLQPRVAHSSAEVESVPKASAAAAADSAASKEANDAKFHRIMTSIDHVYQRLSDAHGFPSERLGPAMRILGMSPTPHEVDKHLKELGPPDCISDQTFKRFMEEKLDRHFAKEQVQSLAKYLRTLDRDHKGFLSMEDLEKAPAGSDLSYYKATKDGFANLPRNSDGHLEFMALAEHLLGANLDDTDAEVLQSDAADARQQESWPAHEAVLSAKAKDDCHLYFSVRGKPAVLERTGDISFLGNIKKERGCDCIVSFPGKFQSGWDSLVDSKNLHSVGCVFLCTEKDGLGQHYREEDSAHCMCRTIYGERSSAEFHYLQTLPATCSEKEEQLEREKAKAMKTVVIRADASDGEKERAREEAERAWEANDRAAPWGCLWFKRWKERVQEAVGLGQRLKVVYFPGQVGQGIVSWDDLKTADLWNNVGCGGSQKAEIAYLNREKLPYESVDVAHFLKKEFKVGAKVDAFDGRRWWKGTLLEVPQGIPQDPKHAKWHVKGQNGEIWVTDRVRLSNLMPQLLADMGKDKFLDCVVGGLGKGHRVKNSGDFIFPDGTPALAIELSIKSVELLQRLRDVVLNSDLEALVNGKLLKVNSKWEVQIDKTHFCKVFEKDLMKLTELTEHQKAKLQNMEDWLPHSPVHLSAVAGAGKTFMAVHCACNLINKTEGQVLFAAPSAGLGYYFVRWLAQRCDGQLSLHALLDRVVLMQPPYTSFSALNVEGNRLRSMPLTYSKMHFSLAIIDEAHDLFGCNEYQKSFKERVEAQQLLLLSSKSQAMTQFELPDVKEVKLTQVVRCTKRIVAGAAAFQGTAEEKAGVGSLCPAGPPLKTYLFKADQGDEVDYGQYAAKTFSALSDLMRTYIGLSFHHRVALLVPDEHFLDELKKVFVPYLDVRISARRIKVTSFEDSLALLPNHERTTNAEMIVMDTVENAKGLEQLIVLCVGLDQKLGDQSTNLQTRALIYQAMTRAQLQAVVVNHHVQGGWLEFLGLLRFEEKQYDESSAMAETTTQAANQIISEAAISAGEAVESPALLGSDGVAKPSEYKDPKSSDPPSGQLDAHASKEDLSKVTKELKPSSEAAKEPARTQQTTSQVWNTDNNDPITIDVLGFDPRAPKETEAESGAEGPTQLDEADQNAKDAEAAAKYRDSDDKPAICQAAAAGDIAAVRHLIRADSGAVHRTMGSWDALHWALLRGHLEVLSPLAAAGGDVDKVLPWAILNDASVATVARLLELGAAVASKDPSGWTPLHYAANVGHVAVAKLLVEAGAPLDSKNDKGQTPLHWAAEEGRVAVAKLLVEAGAPLDSQNKKGQTPLDMAKEKGNTDVVKLLEEAQG